jgi:NUMOD3 motif-containing protein
MGRQCSQETREKIAARLRGLVRSADTRAKISEAGRGRIVSAETRAKMASSHRKTNTPESTEKTRRGLIGKPLLVEHREKLRQAKLRNPVRYWSGKKRPSASVETRAKMSEALSGRPKPETFRPHIKRPSPYKDVVFRSSYEVRVAKALDALGIEWAYESKSFPLGSFSYLPDFYLPADGSYWEVKGWFSPKSQIKVNAFRVAHPDIPLVVFTKECIEALECAALRRVTDCV